MLNQWHPPPLSITPPSSLDGLGVVLNNTTPFFMGTSIIQAFFSPDSKWFLRSKNKAEYRLDTT
jgi:hypothetical protein